MTNTQLYCLSVRITEIGKPLMLFNEQELDSGDLFAVLDRRLEEEAYWYSDLYAFCFHREIKLPEDAPFVLFGNRDEASRKKLLLGQAQFVFEWGSDTQIPQ